MFCTCFRMLHVLLLMKFTKPKNLMKTYFKGFTLLFFMSILAFNTYGQSYDCKGENTKYRNTKDTLVAKDADDPFSSPDQHEFEGLYYFPVDCQYVFTGTISSPGALKVIDVETNKGTIQLYDYGTLSVDVKGETYHLTVYKNISMPEFRNNKEAIFIPIKDKSSGPKPKETFANGRYVIIQPPASGDQVILDLNMAINPFENYNSKFSSLIVPESNELLAPVLAGERKYEDR
jgi:uncharacterized protein (DUF1684 family)